MFKELFSFLGGDESDESHQYEKDKKKEKKDLYFNKGGHKKRSEVHQPNHLKHKGKIYDSTDHT